MVWIQWSFWLFCLSLVRAEGFYKSDPNVIELTSANFDKVIQRTNYTTLVEFYAPWCGYCQQLKRSIQSAAKSLDGVVQVAAVNCDEAVNKNLCAQNRITSYPTIMVYRPPKIALDRPYEERPKLHNHANEVYKGERKLKPMVDFALSRVKNYVKKLLRFTKFEQALGGTHKNQYAMVLFSKRDKIPPLFKAITLDWLGMIDAFLIWNDKLAGISDFEIANLPNISQFLQQIESKANETNSVFVVFDRFNDDYHLFEGEPFNKKAIAEFLHQFGTPNEGPSTKRESFLTALKTNKKAPKKSKPKSKSKSKGSPMEQDEL